MKKSLGISVRAFVVSFLAMMLFGISLLAMPTYAEPSARLAYVFEARPDSEFTEQNAANLCVNSQSKRCIGLVFFEEIPEFNRILLNLDVVDVVGSSIDVEIYPLTGKPTGSLTANSISQYIPFASGNKVSVTLNSASPARYSIDVTRIANPYGFALVPVIPDSITPTQKFISSASLDIQEAITECERQGITRNLAYRCSSTACTSNEFEYSYSCGAFSGKSCCGERPRQQELPTQQPQAPTSQEVSRTAPEIADTISTEPVGDVAPVENCANAADDDADSLVDCADSDCNQQDCAAGSLCQRQQCRKKDGELCIPSQDVCIIGRECKRSWPDVSTYACVHASSCAFAEANSDVPSDSASSIRRSPAPISANGFRCLQRNNPAKREYARCDPEGSGTWVLGSCPQETSCRDFEGERQYVPDADHCVPETSSSLAQDHEVPTGTSMERVEEVILGDADQDGIITYQDIYRILLCVTSSSLAQDHEVESSEGCSNSGDTNGDGRITFADFVQVADVIKANGDINADGDTTEADALLIVDMWSRDQEFDRWQVLVADLNRDGYVTPQDAQAIFESLESGEGDQGSDRIDLIELAPLADWGIDRNNIQFGGAASEPGTASYVSGVVLENGASTDRAVQVNPPLRRHFSTIARFDLIVPQENPIFEGEFGFLGDAQYSEGNQLLIMVRQGSDGEFLYDNYIYPDARLDTIRLDLSRWAGQAILFQISVSAAQPELPASTNALIWKKAEIRSISFETCGSCGECAEKLQQGVSYLQLSNDITVEPGSTCIIATDGLTDAIIDCQDFSFTADQPYTIVPTRALDLGSASNLRIENCRFTGVTALTVHSSTQGLQLSNNQYSFSRETWDSVALLFIGYVRDVVIQDNSFIRASTVFREGPMDMVTITRNIFDQSGIYSILIDDGDAVITNNLFRTAVGQFIVIPFASIEGNYYEEMGCNIIRERLRRNDFEPVLDTWPDGNQISCTVRTATVCEPLMESGQDKENIVIVPVGYEDPYDALREHIPNCLGFRSGKLGIFELPPYSANIDKFNIYLYTKADENNFASRGPYDQYAIVQQDCPFIDHEIVIADTPDYSGWTLPAPGRSITPPGIISVTSPMIDDDIVGGKSGLVCSHEFGHAFAAFNDEYPYYDQTGVIRTSSPGAIDKDNCDTSPNCQKWAGIPGTECIPTCSFQDWYRSEPDSIMGTGLAYGEVHINTLEQLLQQAENPAAPQCGATISSSLTLQSDMACTGTGLNIEGNDVVIDCNGHSMTGTDMKGYGVSIQNSERVTVKNCRISNFYVGILAESSSSINLYDNTLSDNFKSQAGWFNINVGLLLDDTNPQSNLGGGIVLIDTRNAFVYHNTAHNVQNGISLYDIQNSMVINNDFSRNNGWGIHLHASDFNTISDNDLSYLFCRQQQHCEAAGILVVMGSDNNNILRNDLRFGGDGFFLGNERGQPSNNNYVAFNDGSYSPNNAFESTFSRGNIFYSNIASHSNYGFWLGFSTNNQILENEIDGNLASGIAIDSGERNVIQSNLFKDNEMGVQLFASQNRFGTGQSSTDTDITANTFISNAADLSIVDTTNSEISQNTFFGTPLPDIQGPGMAVHDNVLATEEPPIPRLSQNQFQPNNEPVECSSCSECTYLINTLNRNVMLASDIELSSPDSSCIIGYAPPIEDLTFDCNGNSIRLLEPRTPEHAQFAFIFTRLRNSRIRNCNLDFENGVSLGSGSTGNILDTIDFSRVDTRGVFVPAPTGTLDIRNSIFSVNPSQDGAGISIHEYTSLTLENNQFSGSGRFLRIQETPRPQSSGNVFSGDSCEDIQMRSNGIQGRYTDPTGIDLECGVQLQ